MPVYSFGIIRMQSHILMPLQHINLKTLWLQEKLRIKSNMFCCYQNVFNYSRHSTQFDNCRAFPYVSVCHLQQICCMLESGV